MKKLCFLSYLALLLLPPVHASHAKAPDTLQSPQAGILCDPYFCANEHGISRALTELYLGKPTASKLFNQGDFDLSEFTFSNGIFCDTKERLCREDRYYGADGKRSGKISSKYTQILFGSSRLPSPHKPD